MKRNNVLIYLSTAFLALGQAFSRGNFPTYVEVLGGTIVNYGFIQSVQTLSNLLFIFPAALLADKLGHKRLMLSGSVIYALSYLIIVFAPHWEYLLMGGFGTGLAQGMIMPSTVAILAHDNPTNRINIFTKNETTRWGTLALGFFLSSAFFVIFNNEFSYSNLQLTMIVTLFVTSLAIIPSFLLKNTEDWRNSSVEKRPDVNIRTMIKSPEVTFIAGFLFISIIIGFGAGFLVPFTQPYFVRRFSLGPSEVNIIMGTAQVLTAMCMGAIPLLASKIGDLRVIYLTQGISIPLILILAYSTFLPLSLIAFLFRIVLMNMSRPAQTTILQAYVPATFRARVQSLTQVADRLGRSFSPSMSAIIIEDTNDFAISYTITAGMYTAAVSILVLITRNLRRNLRLEKNSEE